MEGPANITDVLELPGNGIYTLASPIAHCAPPINWRASMRRINGNFLASTPSPIQLGNGRRPDIAESPKIVQVLLLAATQVVSHCDADLIMILTQDVVANAIASRYECYVLIADVDHGTAPHSICTCPTVERSHSSAQPYDLAELGGVRLE
jgi:hypothetical protein